MKKYLLGCLLIASALLKETAYTQAPAKITAGEYFIDNDPGPGSASPITVNTMDSLSLSLNLSTNGLVGGFHQLFIRFEDANNYWSIAEQRTFYIDSSINHTASRLKAGEYFFDKDPGAGKANILSTINTDTVNSKYSLATTNLKTGFHQLFIRYKNASNQWSIAEQRTFYIDKDSSLKASPIIAGEYFFTKDPGVGKGTPLTISKTDSINQTFNLNVPSSTGKQYAEIRFKDSSGKWSIAESRKITITAIVNSENSISASLQKPITFLSVYPNPSSDFVYLAFNDVKEEKVSISVLDPLGKVFLSKEAMTSVGANKVSLSLKNFSPGTYLVRLVNEEHEQQTLKIIKE